MAGKKNGLVARTQHAPVKVKTTAKTATKATTQATPKLNGARAQAAPKARITAQEAGAKLILTIPEASVLTHISEEVLRKELKIGKLRGVIRGRGWKIHRAHLEEYVAHLYVPRKFERHVEDSRKAMQIEGNQEKRE